MLRATLLVSFSVSLLVLSTTIAGAQQEQQTIAPKKAYQALLDEFEEVGSAHKMAGPFLDFAQRYSKHPEAIDALAWVATQLRYRPEATRAIGFLERDHLKSRRLGEVLGRVATGLTPAAERLLQVALDKSPHAGVQANACYHLVELLDGQLRLADEIKQNPTLRRRAEQYYGKTLTNHLSLLSAKKVTARQEELCETLLRSFEMTPIADGTMGQFAKRRLFALRHLSVGKRAPDISGTDIQGRSFKLSDYHGKVIVLSFWGHW